MTVTGGGESGTDSGGNSNTNNFRHSSFISGDYPPAAGAFMLHDINKNNETLPFRLPASSSGRQNNHSYNSRRKQNVIGFFGLKDALLSFWRRHQSSPPSLPFSNSDLYSGRFLHGYLPLIVIILVVWIILQAILFYRAISISPYNYVIHNNGHIEHTKNSYKYQYSEIFSSTIKNMVHDRMRREKLQYYSNVEDAKDTTTPIEVNNNIELYERRDINNNNMLINQTSSMMLSQKSKTEAIENNPSVSFNTKEQYKTTVFDASLWRAHTSFVYSPDEKYQLIWEYNMEEKDWPYVGNRRFLTELFPKEALITDRRVPNYSVTQDNELETVLKLPRHYYNTLAVFPGSSDTYLHGLLGLSQTGAPLYGVKPSPLPADKVDGGLSEALKDGGFYLNLSNALPLDRTDVLDSRDPVCLTQKYNLLDLDDVSIIITFYNEPLSTLLRTLHSVLNYTPPPMLREIILVDDHSDSEGVKPGSFLYTYIKSLPKVKLMRLPERRGIVPARLAGARMSTAPIFLVLDSHVEVSTGWLEPQLQRLKESPKSIVFPQILSIDSADFSYNPHSGIGCFLTFKWSMQERPYMSGVFDKPDAIPSPSMAGGLFAVRREWFFDLGGYDEEFSMWGAENVEMGFRVWQCGGRLECVPCSKVYHIYREKGVGYSVPSESLEINRLRTARLWTDDFYPLAKQFIGGNKVYTDAQLGSFDKILAIKKRLDCKNFKWFLQNVDPGKKPQDINAVKFYKEFRIKTANMCLDNLQHRENQPYGLYQCHGLGGSQSFFTVNHDHKIYSATDETVCLGYNLTLTSCEEESKNGHWYMNSTLSDGTMIEWVEKSKESSDRKCLGVDENNSMLQLLPCNKKGSIFWDVKFQPLEPYVPLKLSPNYVAHEKRLQQRSDSETIPRN